MPLFKVTMTQTIEHEYYVEAFDEAEAIILAHEEDAAEGDGHWYRSGHDGDVQTTAHEMSPDEIAKKNTLDRAISKYIHKDDPDNDTK